MTEHATTCTSYGAGHCIDATAGFSAMVDESIQVHAAVDADGWIVLTSDRVTRRVWNHDPAQVAERLADSGGVAFLRGDAVLTIGYGSGQRAFFSISPTVTACHTARPRDGRLDA